MRAYSNAPGASPRRWQIIKAYTRPAQRSAASLSAVEPAVAILDKHGLISFSSPAMGDLLQSSREKLEGREVATLLPGLPFKEKTPGDNLAFAESWGREATWQKLKGCLPDGDSIPLEVSLKKLSMNADEYILLGIRPANEDFEAAPELDELIERARAKSDPVMITDTDGVIHFVNRAFEDTTGYSLKEVRGQPASIVKPGFRDAEFQGSMRETLLAGYDLRSIFSNRRKAGEIFHEDTHIRPFINRFGVTSHFVATGRGLSAALQATLLRLQREAWHDPLTELPNRNLFLDRLRQSIAHAARDGKKLSLVFIDLDNFKEINDSYGHAAGDAVLRATANSLSASVRDEDTVSRLGGDEFALILLNIHGAEDIELISKKIQSSLAEGVTFENRLIPIRASLGASIYPDDGFSGDALLKQADSAMYMAKSAGGLCLHFFSEKTTI